MKNKRKIINKMSLVVLVLCVLSITALNAYSRITGKGNAGIAVYSQKLKNFTTELCRNEKTDYDKAAAISSYLTHNFKYDFNETVATAKLKYVNLDKVFENKKGICAELSVLYSAMCHSQDIRCYCVSGKKKDGSNVYHQWNRLCIDDKWYEVDIATNTGWLEKYGKDAPITIIKEIDGLYAEHKSFSIDSVM